MSKVHASLFSGFGGADLAAHWVGWENAFWCEIDGFCQQVLRYWFPQSKGYENIKETDFTPWRGKVDVLTGGFPCQPFSVAGQRKGAADDRYLWPEMLRAIREIRPAWVVGENVAGLLSMVQPGCEITVESQASLFEAADKETLLEEEYVVGTMCRDLEQEGYSVQPLVIPACAVGAPTEGIEFGLLPTVQTQGLKVCDRNGKTRFMDLKLLPTPTAMMPADQDMVKLDARRETVRSRKGNGNGFGVTLNELVKKGMLPTPQARDWKGISIAEGKRMRGEKTSFGATLPDYIRRTTGESSQLNPLFVEEMMGFPSMWSVLPFLSENGGDDPSKDTATPSFPK